MSTDVVARSQVRWRETQKSSFIISTWNIGHFANGKKDHSLINPKNFQKKLNLYRRLLTDSIRADIVCVNEYSKIFGIDNNQRERQTKSLLFGSFKSRKEGRQVGFSCNSIFSNIRIRNTKERLFRRSEPFIKETPRAANYYYLVSDLYVDGKRIKLVCAHTTSRAIKICRAQIKELIEEFASYDRVIMCGDWNTTNFSQFRKAGYSLANKGSLITFPSKSYAFDNIMVKGLRIDDVRVIKTNLSDHYPLVCRLTVK
jgi:endonuclease/exonuclease/phosphatase family metal-dependent hydrolase